MTGRTPIQRPRESRSARLAVAALVGSAAVLGVVLVASPAQAVGASAAGADVGLSGGHSGRCWTDDTTDMGGLARRCDGKPPMPWEKGVPCAGTDDTTTDATPECYFDTYGGGSGGGSNGRPVLAYTTGDDRGIDQRGAHGSGGHGSGGHGAGGTGAGTSGRDQAHSPVSETGKPATEALSGAITAGPRGGVATAGREVPVAVPATPLAAAGDPATVLAPGSAGLVLAAVSAALLAGGALTAGRRAVARRRSG